MDENGTNGTATGSKYVDGNELLQRIVTREGVFGGKPVIRGYRIAVEHILGYLAAGTSVEELLNDFDFLEPDDIRACFEYAYRAVAGERFEPIELHETVSR